MEVIELNKNSNNLQEVEKLLNTIFPTNELIEFKYLIKMTSRKNVKFLSFYDNQLLGISYTYKYKNLVFVLYLGVNTNIQSMGLGTKIINYLKKIYKDLDFVLNIEPIIKDCSNIEQRIKRLNFYKKNAFFETNYYLKDDIDYSILSTNKYLNIRLYKKLLKRFSYSLIGPKIYKRR